MKKEILFYGFIFILIIIAIIILNFDFDKKIYNRYFKNNQTSNSNNSIDSGNLGNSKESGVLNNRPGDNSSGGRSSNGFNGGGGSEFSGRGSRSGGEEQEKTKEPPSDMEIRECGFYTEEYKVCAGVCPEGECVSEGRSCYCKKN